jgi:hypothetical protein
MNNARKRAAEVQSSAGKPLFAALCWRDHPCNG